MSLAERVGDRRRRRDQLHLRLVERTHVKVPKPSHLGNQTENGNTRANKGYEVTSKSHTIPGIR